LSKWRRYAANLLDMAALYLFPQEPFGQFFYLPVGEFLVRLSHVPLLYKFGYKAVPLGGMHF
jgi:hypothetical protein